MTPEQIQAVLAKRKARLAKKLMTTSTMYNGDCLEVMKELKDNSVDLLFCDLPYGQTSCKWDSLIDLDIFWKQVNRVCKIDCPMFFTCSTKFGVSLINSNPKNFRYDLVWVKSAPCGFLNAKKMPMKKHEMVYVFYRKLPMYDLSSHQHKFLRCEKNGQGRSQISREMKAGVNNLYGDMKGGTIGNIHGTNYEPPLPNSVIQTETFQSSSMYGNESKKIRYKNEDGTVNKELNLQRYDPPLPHSLLEIKSEKGKHATQKPTELIKWCLKYYSKEFDTVLDPTMGSGSTGVACKEMNRNFIGIELDEKIYSVAEKRLTD
jgi:site-specific DNA-methyltransferase (adenine-specific)